MTQEELYWYEKRLRMKADAKEHEIREHYNFLLNRPIPQWMRESKSQMDNIEREKSRLRWKCNQEIEYARLEILEPILDYEEKKRFKSLRDARERNKQEEERKRIEEERKRVEEERKRQEQDFKRKQKQEQELKENQRIIEPLVSSLLQRKKLSWEQRCQIAKYTNNHLAIKKLKYDNSINVLDALLTNPYIDSATIQHIHKRKKDKIDSKNEFQTIRRESKENSGCLKSLITILFIAVSIISK